MGNRKEGVGASVNKSNTTKNVTFINTLSPHNAGRINISASSIIGIRVHTTLPRRPPPPFVRHTTVNRRRHYQRSPSRALNSRLRWLGCPVNSCNVTKLNKVVGPSQDHHMTKQRHNTMNKRHTTDAWGNVAHSTPSIEHTQHKV